MLQSESPTVSIVLCTYNGERYLRPQLESILQQTYPLHEVVVVDDGSTDGTWNLLEQYAGQHSRMRLYRNNANLGYNKNFEKALLLATGEVLALADQDDIWHPEKIAIMLGQWPQECLLIYCESADFVGTPPQNLAPNPLMNRLQGTDPRKLALYNTISGHAMLIRRSLLSLALPFQPAVYYDWWLAIIAFCNGGVAYCNQVLVYRRLHSHNATLPKGMSRKEILIYDLNKVMNQLAWFDKTPNMKEADRAFFKELYGLWQAAMKGAKRRELFFFLMRHRKQIYASKNRKLAFFSHLKRSFRYAYKSASL